VRHHGGARRQARVSSRVAPGSSERQTTTQGVGAHIEDLEHVRAETREDTSVATVTAAEAHYRGSGAG
jgi:hypothetical protein